MLQLLLLHEQTAGHTLPLAVTASRGEETRRQHQQVPQRELHLSAQPDRRGQRGAQQVEEKSLKQGSTAGETGKLSLRDLSPACRERADRVTGTLPQFQFIGIISWSRAVSQSVGGGRVLSQHQEMDNVGGMERKREREQERESKRETNLRR